MKIQHAIVVGGTSGLGLALVEALVAQGAKVAVVGRDFSKLEELSAEVISVPHDVRETEQAERLFMETTQALGGLDLFIYAAGVMPPVEPNEFDTAKDREMILVNDMGAVAWINACAARFAGTGHGCIVGIGSAAGDRGRQGQPVYNASKAFLHTYLEAVRNRLAKRGVSVVTIKPGPIATPMTAHMDQSKMMSLAVAAAKVLAHVGRNGEFYLSPVHWLAMRVIQNIPSFLFRRLKV